MRRAIVGVAAGLILGSWPPAEVGAQVGRFGARGRVIPTEPPLVTDEQALKTSGFDPADAAPLLAYLRQRTLSENDISRIQTVIRRMGAEGFEARVAATREVELFGPAAVKPLKDATRHPDPEVAYRAGEALRRLEKVPHEMVAAAAVRAVAKLAPPEATPTLLAFLPLADNESVADEIRFALATLAFRAGRPDPALLEALADPRSVRRAAAGVALAEGGGRRGGDHVAAVRRAALKEPEPEGRFRMLFALLTAAGDAGALEPLIDSLADLPRGRLWQAEDFLLQLSGAGRPAAKFGKSAESVAEARDAWKAWRKQSPPADFAAFRYRPRVTGKTLVVALAAKFGLAGTVLELGPDMAERWRIATLQSPMDARYLPDGRVAVAEQNGNRISIRSPDGRIVAVRNLGAAGARPVAANPHLLQVLPDGNFLVTCKNQVLELRGDRDQEVWAYPRNTYDIIAACRLVDRRTAVLVHGGEVLFLDAQGKETDAKLKVNSPYSQGSLEEPAPGRLLVTESSRVAEYDLNAESPDKPVWTRAVSSPRSVQRLPNGNTLVVDGGTGRLIECAPSGEEVWSHTLPGEASIYRAYRH